MLAMIVCTAIAPTTFSLAASSNSISDKPREQANAVTQASTPCLPEGGAYLRARLSGSINAELSWNDRSLSCAGSVRPNAEGIRLRFAAADGSHRLVLLFGVTGLKEGQTGKALPANLTIIREGTGEFYGTQGDNKCTVDDISQQPLQGLPLKQRAYRIIARGFCTQPARAVNGDGAVLVTRFDFAGRADFVSDDNSSESSQPTLPST